MRDSRTPYVVDVTFDHRQCQGLKADPHTYEDHLMWVTEYTLKQRGLRPEHRTQVRNSLTRCSLMELRAVFIFSVFERKREAEVHRGRLDEPQRIGIWLDLLRAGLVRMSPRGFAATNAAGGIHANIRNAYAPEPQETAPQAVRQENDWTTMD